MKEFLRMLQITWIQELLPGIWQAMETTSDQDNIQSSKRWQYFFRSMAYAFTLELVECSTLDQLVLEVSNVLVSEFQATLKNLFGSN